MAAPGAGAPPALWELWWGGWPPTSSRGTLMILSWFFSWRCTLTLKMSGRSQGVNVSPSTPPLGLCLKLYLYFDKNTFKVKRKNKKTWKLVNLSKGIREEGTESSFLSIENGLHIFYMIFTPSENDKSYRTLCQIGVNKFYCLKNKLKAKQFC